MNRHTIPSRALLAMALLPVIPSVLAAQDVVRDDPWCDETSGSRDADQYCEVREYTLDSYSQLSVDARPNGGIRVEAWDRNEIGLRARVSAWSRTGDAEAIVREIRLHTGDNVAAEGPDQERREGWSVSYRLMVPRTTSLEMESTNGGIHVIGVHSRMDFRTLNGGITLDDVGGDVRGRTTNGGLNVSLSGDRWDGAGLDLRTTNGGVDLRLPDGYQATLETGTTNGGLRSDFPITLRGRIHTREITTELNGGGPTIRAITTNGGVRIREG